MHTLVISDLHGDYLGLIALLRAAGAVDAADKRVPNWRIIQLGDLIHGGNPRSTALPGVDDRRCAELAQTCCDTVLIGNHELPHLWLYGFPRFEGMREQIGHTYVALYALRDAGKLVPAVAIDGWLLTHAGAHADYLFGYPDADTAANAINALFRLRLEGGRHPMGIFDGIGRRRGGSEDYGGIFWCDWQELTRRPSPIPQIVGHTPQEVAPTRCGNLWCVDAGAALSGRVCALVRREGGDWEPLVAEGYRG